MNEMRANNIKGVVVDAGHGGSDPGATHLGLREKDFNLLAANYIYKRLKELGIPAAITRETDRSLTKEERINTMINSFGSGRDVIVLSNHINAGGGEGAEVYYPLRNNNELAEMILTEIGKEGQIKRGTFQRRLPEDPSKDYYYIQRQTPNVQSLLIEYGFIDNPNDNKKIQNNLLNYAEAVVRAVANYAGVKYIPPKENEETTGRYIVQKGDSLYYLAQKFNTTVDALRTANSLTSDILQIGKILVIPTPPKEDGQTIRYTVQPGDSLWKLAEKFQTSVNKIRMINNLQTDLLKIGQVLYIPSANIDIDESVLYTVKPGDTLWSVATRYNITVNQIREQNNLASDELKVGQVLRLKGNPETSKPTGRTYTIKSGDTLYKISQQFGVPIEKIMEENKLKTTMLQLNQVLKIPE